MSAIRLIGRLDIKGPNLIKGIQLEGLRVIGDPNQFALSYYRQGIDELLYIDAVASLYGRNSLLEVVECTTHDIFVPVTVGGGIRSIDDIHHLLRAGADKVAINTAAIARPNLIAEAAAAFGSQCIVVSIAAKRRPEGGWEAYVEGGRERTGVEAVSWAEEAVRLGAGELLITSVDREGGQRGYDVDLVRAIAEHSPVPVIASGGAGNADHLIDVIRSGKADAVAVATVLHFGKSTVVELKRALSEQDIPVRDAAEVDMTYSRSIGNNHWCRGTTLWQPP